MEGTGKTNYREHGEGKPQRARKTRRKTNHGEHGDGKEGADTLGGIYAAAA
jgi:hypothetical protein